MVGGLVVLWCGLDEQGAIGGPDAGSARPARHDGADARGG